VDHRYKAGMNNFSLCLGFGEGVSVVVSQAVTYYRNATDRGHSGAQADLGFCLQLLRGIDFRLIRIRLSVPYTQLFAFMLRLVVRKPQTMIQNWRFAFPLLVIPFAACDQFRRHYICAVTFLNCSKLD
jgi:hypothetical protein